jgi:hypothetical protein
MNHGKILNSVHPEMVDFGSGQGRSDFNRRRVHLRRGVQKRRMGEMPFMDGH